LWVSGLLVHNDTHRPEGGPMLLLLALPEDPTKVRVIVRE